jgi:hypothetical protein
LVFGPIAVGNNDISNAIAALRNDFALDPGADRKFCPFRAFVLCVTGRGSYETAENKNKLLECHYFRRGPSIFVYIFRRSIISGPRLPASLIVVRWPDLSLNNDSASVAGTLREND